MAQVSISPFSQSIGTTQKGVHVYFDDATEKTFAFTREGLVVMSWRDTNSDYWIALANGNERVEMKIVDCANSWPNTTAGVVQAFNDIFSYML